MAASSRIESMIAARAGEFVADKALSASARAAPVVRLGGRPIHRTTFAIPEIRREGEASLPVPIELRRRREPALNESVDEVLRKRFATDPYIKWIGTQTILQSLGIKSSQITNLLKIGDLGTAKVLAFKVPPPCAMTSWLDFQEMSSTTRKTPRTAQ